MSPQGRQVFFDQSGWRSRIVSAFNWSVSGVGAVLVTSLVMAVMINPTTPAFFSLDQERSISAVQAAGRTASSEPRLDPAHMRNTTAAAAAAAKRYAHFVLWDGNGLSSLKRHAHQLDGVIGEWLSVTGPATELQRGSQATEDQLRRWSATHAPHLKVYPLVNNYNNAEKRWDATLVNELLTSPEKQSALTRQLTSYLVEGNYPGLVLDFENFSVKYRNEYTAFATLLRDQLHAVGKTLAVQVSMADPAYDARALSEAADEIIAMIYDEHTENGKPGPLAGQGWSELQIDAAFAAVPAQKLIISIGSYAYDWQQQGKAQELSIQEAWELLAESGSSLNFDRDSLNPTFSYRNDSDGQSHTVWLLDGVTAYNQIGAALSARPAGLALWRLGTEDPSVWTIFGRERAPDQKALDGVRVLNPGYDVLYKGKGEVLDVRGEPTAGARKLTFDAGNNLITDQEIITHPRSTVVYRRGASNEKLIALTFDDGPDPRYTDRILDVLASRQAPASFFVIGSAAVVNQSILQRIYREGHDIGNHTFTHANASDVSAEHLRLELNATQRLIEATVGVRTRLFRPPFAADLEPHTIDAAEALRVAAGQGYLTIGMAIDPKDWFQAVPRLIVAKTLAAARRGDGNVVLLHDAGGSREATITALPEIIDTLRAEGFKFVTIHELIGLSREQVMPSVATDGALVAHVNSVGFLAISGFNWLAQVIFYSSIGLGFIRLMWVASFALVHKRRETLRSGVASSPASVTAIVPALNESAVICRTLDALLASRAINLKIIVVDDGSTDGTADLVRKVYGGETRLTLICKPNGGKWSALNAGLAATGDEIIVTLDADTLFAPDAIVMLVRHFADPSIGAVSGHAVVGNRVNLITRFQALEYATNQNLDRRALEVVNGITVVPGAIGAWRRPALQQIGGYTSDTLAEDADTTVRLIIAGWKVLYEPEAVARTEAPETFRQFMKQRLRWMFGTLQVAYKHRGVFSQMKPFGLAIFGLPNIIVFQFLFTLMAPIIDIMMLWSLISALATYNHAEGMPPALSTVFIYWIAFLLMEIATAVLAISLDRRDHIWHLLPLLLVQRFIYRQLLYITAIRVALAAFRGTLQGWGKLSRTGNVSSNDPAKQPIAAA